MKKCPYCGKENTDETVICVKCHAGFSNEEQKTETAPEETSRSRKKKTKE